jgi:hypothetical protein
MVSIGNAKLYNDGLLLDRELLSLACSEERKIVMVHGLAWKTQPSATRICWLTIGEHHRRIATLHQDNPA